jgi:uncharacterized protein
VIRPFIFASLLAVSAGDLWGQTSDATGSPPAAPQYEIPKEMSPYFVAILVRGPNWTPRADTPEQLDLTRRHLAYFRTMAEQRKLLVFGPLLDGGVRQGMSIVAAANIEEARRIVGDDPAVVAGRLAFEMHPVMLPSLATLQVRY